VPLLIPDQAKHRFALDHDHEALIKFPVQDHPVQVREPGHDDPLDIIEPDLNNLLLGLVQVSTKTCRNVLGRCVSHDFSYRLARRVRRTGFGAACSAGSEEGAETVSAPNTR